MRFSVNILLFFLGTSFFLTQSCSDPAPVMNKTDLMKYGIPLSINAPKDISVKEGTIGSSSEVTIKSTEENYDLQIISSVATSLNKEILKTSLTEEVKNNDGFEIIKEDENGFLFKYDFDENTPTYDFRHFKIQGDRKYIFQASMMGIFTKEEADNMYQSVK